MAGKHNHSDTLCRLILQSPVCLFCEPQLCVSNLPDFCEQQGHAPLLEQQLFSYDNTKKTKGEFDNSPQ